MGTDKLGGRKMIVWILTLLMIESIFIIMAIKNLLDKPSCLEFLQAIVWVTLGFMGANAAEHLANKKTEVKQ